MDKLLHHYEQELGRLRQAARQYAEAYPVTAEALELEPDGSTDPEVERLLQSVALLNASMQQCIEENRREFHRALLQTLQPHYLQVIPACGIVQVDTSSAQTNEINTASKLPRGATLRSYEHTFTTAYDMCIAPIDIVNAQFKPTIDLPATLRLPRQATSAFTMELAGGGTSFDKPPLQKLRLYIDAEPELRAQLRDAILMHCLGVCLEVAESWRMLPQAPFAPCGFTNEESLLPCRPGPQSPRLLTEFFQLPEKFNFIDVDLAFIAPHCPPMCTRIALHLVLPACQSLLRQANADNFRPACTPLINLFPTASAPIILDGRNEAYTIAPAQQGCAIYSIDSVARLSRKGDKIYPPFHGTEHTSPGPYWQIEKQESLAIRFIDRAQNAMPIASGSIVAYLTCTNAQLPPRPAGLTTDASACGFPFRLLHDLTCTNHLCDSAELCDTLFDEDTSLPALCRLLKLHGCQYTEVLKDLIVKPSTAWLQHPMGRLHMHGTEFTLVVDEPALRSHSIHALADVLAIALADKLRENRFAQLRIANEDGRLLYQARPHIGTRRLA